MIDVELGKTAKGHFVTLIEIRVNLITCNISVDSLAVDELSHHDILLHVFENATSLVGLVHFW